VTKSGGGQFVCPSVPILNSDSSPCTRDLRLCDPVNDGTTGRLDNVQRCERCFASSPATGLKAKFASWLEAGSKLVADKFEAKFHYAIWFEPASNQLQTGSESDSVMEFGGEPASSC